MPTSSKHVPVLLEEVLAWLNPQPGMRIVDGTLGGGGHTRRLAERVAPGGVVVALDRDPAAIERAARELAGLPVRLVHANFAELPEVMRQLGIPPVGGVLLDLGLSSDQLAEARRGFSFATDGPLDLRFDPTQGPTAADLIQRLSERELADLIYQYGEERLSRRIARRIVEQRGAAGPITTAGELAELVRRCYPPARGRGHRIHPATRTFQALRIAVNDELGALDRVLQQVPDCLAPGGRLAIISFHSLEDRRVKQAFRDDPRYQVLTKKPIRPTERELAENPRCRSARMRVAARSAT